MEMEGSDGAFQSGAISLIEGPVPVGEKSKIIFHSLKTSTFERMKMCTFEWLNENVLLSDSELKWDEKRQVLA